MVIDQIVPSIAPKQEPASETEHVVEIVGGGLRHRVRRDSGRGRWVSARGAGTWVRCEELVLERETGGGRRPRWQAVGGHVAAGAHGERTRRDVGAAEARCVAEVESAQGAPLKVSLRIEAAEEGRYRLRWSLRGIGGRLETAAGEQCLRIEGTEAGVRVDWSDVVEGHGDVVAAETVGAGVDIVFGPFELGARQAVELDPTIEQYYYIGPGSMEGLTANARRLLRASDGRLCAIYLKESSGANHIFVSESTDDGANWTKPEIPESDDGDLGAGEEPGVCIDSRDYVHLVFRDSSDNICYRKYRAGEWSTALDSNTVSTDAASTARPSVAADEFGQPHVVWESGSDQPQIVWATRLAGEWTSPDVVSTAAGMDSRDQSVPSIALDVEGNLHVVWQGTNSAYTDHDQIWHAEYADGSWGAPDRVSTASGMESYDQTLPCAAVDADGNVYAVWQGKATGYVEYEQIWCAQRTTSWQTPDRVSTATGMDTKHQVYPSVVVDANGDAHVLFEGEVATGGRKVYRAKKSDSEWGCESETSAGQHRRPNARWSQFATNGGYLDWLCLDGDVLGGPEHANEEHGGPIDNTNWRSQSFKAPESRQLGFVQVPLKAESQPTATMRIYAADANGLPTGSSLGSAASGRPTRPRTASSSLRRSSI